MSGSRPAEVAPPAFDWDDPDGGLGRTAGRVGRVLEQCPLATVNELTALLGVSRSLVSSGILKLEENGMAERACLGWQRRIADRWWLTQTGIDCFQRENWGSWNEEWALSRRLERLPLVETFYSAAAQLKDLGPFQRFKWLQKTAADAAVDYETGWAVVLWSGKSESIRHLDTRVQKVGEEMAGLAAGGGDCWPSAIVIVAVDCWQVQVAREVLAEFQWQDQLYVWCCVHERYEVSGKPRARRGWVYQSLQRPGPDNWSWQSRVEKSLWSRLDAGGSGKMLVLCHEWPGVTFRLGGLFVDLSERSRQARRSLEVLVESGLVDLFSERVPYRFVISRRGVRSLVLLDRVPPKHVGQRVFGQSWASAPRLKTHEEGLMELMGRFAGSGLAVAAGWRYWEYLGGSGGLAPDGLVRFDQGPYGPGWHFVEYERSARSESRIRRKLWGFMLEKRKNRWPVLFVVWDDTVEETFWRIAAEADVPMATTTLARLKEHGPLDNDQCWKVYGEPAEFGSGPNGTGLVGLAG